MYWLEFAGEDDVLAALEASYATDALQVLAPGVATAADITPERVAALAFTRAAGPVLGQTTGTLKAAKECLRSTPLASSQPDVPQTVAVRARDIRATANVDTQAVERELGAILVDRGFRVDLDTPDRQLRVLFAAGDPARDAAASPPAQFDPVTAGQVSITAESSVCLLGWTTVAPDRQFGHRAPTDRPFFRPGSMDPLLARACVMMAGAGPTTRLLDPMCGTGGTLLEGALVGASVLGVDADRDMIHGARDNLQAYLDTQYELCRGDATALPVATNGIDSFVVDVPYGRQSAITAPDRQTLVGDALSELHRVASRGVLVGDRRWIDAALDTGWSIEAIAPRRVHRSLVRYLHVLTRADS